MLQSIWHFMEYLVTTLLHITLLYITKNRLQFHFPLLLRLFNMFINFSISFGDLSTTCESSRFCFSYDNFAFLGETPNGCYDCKAQWLSKHFLCTQLLSYWEKVNNLNDKVLQELLFLFAAVFCCHVHTAIITLKSSWTFLKICANINMNRIRPLLFLVSSWLKRLQSYLVKMKTFKYIPFWYNCFLHGFQLNSYIKKTNGYTGS